MSGSLSCCHSKSQTRRIITIVVVVIAIVVGVAAVSLVVIIIVIIIVMALQRGNTVAFLATFVISKCDCHCSHTFCLQYRSLQALCWQTQNIIITGNDEDEIYSYEQWNRKHGHWVTRLLVVKCSVLARVSLWLEQDRHSQVNCHKDWMNSETLTADDTKNTLSTALFTAHTAQHTAPFNDIQATATTTTTTMLPVFTATDVTEM